MVLTAGVGIASSLVTTWFTSRRDAKKDQRDAIERARKASAAMSVAAKNYLDGLIKIEHERRATCAHYQLQENESNLFAKPGEPKMDTYLFLGRFGEELAGAELKPMTEAMNKAHEELTLCIANLLTEAPSIYLHKKYGEFHTVLVVAADIHNDYFSADPKGYDDELAMLEGTIAKLQVCRDSVDPWLMAQANHLRHLSSLWYRLFCRKQMYTANKEELNKGLV
jgi:hypothetical protein